jgi:outer membrane protein OmpA-like peptidoglycan-associated protein
MRRVARRHRASRHAVLIPLVLAAAMTAISAAPSRAQVTERCQRLAAELETALAGTDLAAMSQTFKSIQSGDCGGTFAHCAGRRVALAHLEEVYARHQAGTPEADLKPLLAQALAHGQPWQVAFAAGEAEESAGGRERARFERAALHYQAALDDLGQEPLCPEEKDLRPSPEEAEAIYNRAVVAYLLSPGAVEPPRNRCGDENHAWLFVGSVCGYAPSGRPLPIQFAAPGTQLTPKGARTVEILVDYLKRKKPAGITLIGHTDARGSAAFNLRLSRARLDAVAAALKAGGYGGEIALDPRGKTEPFPLAERDRYSADEINDIDRRVEFRLGG